MSTADVTGGKPISVLFQSISGVSAINPLVALYDIHGGKKGAILLFCPVHHTRHHNIVYNNVASHYLSRCMFRSLKLPNGL
jgi:hypothetical protein